MSISVRNGSGALKTVAEIWVRDPSNALVQIEEIWVRDPSNTLVQVWGGSAGGGFEATADPTDVFGSTSSHAPATVSTSIATVTVSPPGSATYSWGSPDPGWSAITPSAPSSAFRYSGLGPGDSQSTTFTCLVTRGASTASPTVNATVTNFGT